MNVGLVTGSLMPKEVIEAISYSADEYVNLDDLQDKVGERIAELLECEYATVSSGCFGAMSIGMAGVITGKDPKKVKMKVTIAISLKLFLIDKRKFLFKKKSLNSNSS